MYTAEPNTPLPIRLRTIRILVRCTNSRQRTEPIVRWPTSSKSCLLKPRLWTSLPEMRPQCPVGVNTCGLLDEVGKLRQRVDELSILVSTDELTGVYNYRHLLWTLGQELERVRRHGGSFA